MSPKSGGPRHRPMAHGELDSYENLILLCATDHIQVDKQTGTFNEARLRRIKAQHEAWVTQRVGEPAESLPKIQIRDPEAGTPIRLERIDSGPRLMRLVSHCLAQSHESPELTSESEADLLGGFLQDLTDWVDIWEDIGPAARLKAELSLTGELNDLREAGFVVYAGTRVQVLEGGTGGPQPWPVACIAIHRLDDVLIEAAGGDGDARGAA